MLAHPSSPGRLPLVGRDAELERAQQALDRVVGGDGRVLLVSGEPGIGKTRLVQELAALAEDQGALVAWGGVDEAEGAPPYWPWMQVLDVVLAHADRAVVSAHGALISAIAPAADALVDQPAQPPSADPTTARFRLHQAVVDVLRSVGAQRPLVLVLEDMHWADLSTLELTRFLAARLMAVGVMLVVTYRTVDGGDMQALDDVLASLARQPALERIALEGLSEAEVGLFMAQTTGLRSRREVVARTHARTEGNPFFVGELARLRRSDGDGDGAEGDHETVPVGVRDVLRRRLARLPPATGEMLALGAVLGREFRVATLAATAATDADAVAGALEPAEAAGLIAGIGGATGQLRFSHALVRDTIYRDLSALRRATLHARVGEALERHDAGVRPAAAELAWHFARAAAVLGPERGLDYTIEAAEAAQAAVSPERAEDDLRRALTLVAMLPEGVERWERELDVQNRLAAHSFLTHGLASDAAGRAASRARDLCARIGETEALFHTLNQLGVFHHNRGDFSVEAQIGEQLLTIGRRRSTPEWLTSGHLMVGLAHLHVGRLHLARESLQQARTAAAGLELTPEVADAFFSLHPTVMALQYSGRCAWMLGELGQARAWAGEGLDMAMRIGHPHTTAVALFLAGHIELLERNLEPVRETARRGLAHCEKHRLPAWAVWYRMLGGWTLCEMGRPDDGVAQMTAALAASHASGTGSNKPMFLSLLAEGELRRGDHARALALIDQAFVEMRETLMWKSDLHRRRGELLALHDPRHEAVALDELRKAVAVAEQQGAVALGRLAGAALARLAPGDRAAARPPLPSPADSATLSPRERELLGLVGRGLTDKQIAGELVISLATVRSHLDRIRDKTGCRRRPELTRLADALLRG